MGRVAAKQGVDQALGNQQGTQDEARISSYRTTSPSPLGKIDAKGVHWPLAKVKNSR